MIYPKPKSIYLRGTIYLYGTTMGLWLTGSEAPRKAKQLRSLAILLWPPHQPRSSAPAGIGDFLVLIIVIITTRITAITEIVTMIIVIPITMLIIMGVLRWFRSAPNTPPLATLMPSVTSTDNFRFPDGYTIQCAFARSRLQFCKNQASANETVTNTEVLATFER